MCTSKMVNADDRVLRIVQRHRWWLITEYIYLFFLKCLVRGLTTNGRELPLPTQPSGRVLAVINGAWSLENWSAPVRIRYLKSQLHRYVAACEEGFEVHVALLTYKGWNYTGVWNDRDYVCLRRGELLVIGVYMYPFEPLPKGTFGTAGTLAFQHRKLFLRKRALYDIFICQEDDVAVNVGHIKYFLHWANFFNGTNFYPGFYDSEILYRSKEMMHNKSFNQDSIEISLDWRLKRGQLFKMYETVFFQPSSGASGRIYFLTSKMLARFCQSHSWLTQLHMVKGEFNPFFGSARWMEDSFKIVIPVYDVIRAQVHHLPEKYVKEHLEKYLQHPGSTEPDQFTPIFQRELSSIFSQCSSETNHTLHFTSTHPRSIIRSSSKPLREACRSCLNLGNIMAIEITKQNMFSEFASLMHCCLMTRMKFYHREDCHQSQIVFEL